MPKRNSTTSGMSLVVLCLAALLVAAGCGDEKTDDGGDARGDSSSTGPEAPDSSTPRVADTSTESERGAPGEAEDETAGEAGGGLLSALSRIMGDGDRDAQAADDGWDGKYHMACVNPKCGHAFELEDDDKLMKMMEGGAAHPGPEGLVARCPKCNKMSGLEKTRCPECGKYYISRSARQYVLTGEYRPELDSGCPNCQDDDDDS